MLSLISISIMLPLLNVARAQPVHNSDDFIYIDKGTFSINPGFIKVIKQINLNATRHIINSLNHLSDTYGKYCKKYDSSTVSKKIGNWALINKPFRDVDEAKHFCDKSYHGKLLEIRSRQDLMKAYEMMNKGHEITFANIEYNERRKILVLKSDKTKINA